MECKTLATFLQCNPHLTVSLTLQDTSWLAITMNWPDKALSVKVLVPLEPMKNFEDICFLVLNDLKAQLDEKFKEVNYAR